MIPAVRSPWNDICRPLVPIAKVALAARYVGWQVRAKCWRKCLGRGIVSSTHMAKDEDAVRTELGMSSAVDLEWPGDAESVVEGVHTFHFVVVLSIATCTVNKGTTDTRKYCAEYAAVCSDVMGCKCILFS